MSYLILALVKIFDNIILTAKSIATYKEQRLWSSVLVVISQLIFYLVIGEVINDNTLWAIIIVSVSSGIGNYIAFMINERVRKAAKWTMVITSSDVDDVQRLCEYLVAHNIKYVANKGFTRKWEETIHVTAFSKTKAESRLIEAFLDESQAKYLKEVI